MVWIWVYWLHLTNHLPISVVHVLCTIFDLATNTRAGTQNSFALARSPSLPFKSCTLPMCCSWQLFLSLWAFSRLMQKWTAGLNVSLQFHGEIAGIAQWVSERLFSDAGNIVTKKKGKPNAGSCWHVNIPPLQPSTISWIQDTSFHFWYISLGELIYFVRCCIWYQNALFSSLHNLIAQKSAIVREMFNKYWYVNNKCFILIVKVILIK